MTRMEDSMDILLLCGYFESKYQEEISRKTKTWVENAANTFQKRLIAGFKEQGVNLKVVSAPLIGPWPTAYDDIVFRGFEAGESAENVQYVRFNNIWGYRNISRTAALKKRVRDFVRKSEAKEKAIIVYCPHTPFLEAAVYGKRLDQSIHIHMVVPDLPQYMNLSKKAHPIYDFFKSIDIQKMDRLIAQVNSFMLLTKYMADKLHVGKRPYIVVEGITDVKSIPCAEKKERGKSVAYAGKLVEAFGVKRLIEAFEMIDGQEATLHICGGGELKPYVEETCKIDNRIRYYGVVPAEKANEILQNADVLVNPRQNDDEYTKYSFPSKNIEYLMTGNAVVAYMLDGMPDEYRGLLQVPGNNSVAALAEAIRAALTDENSEQRKRQVQISRTHLYYTAVAEQICGLLNGLSH